MIEKIKNIIGHEDVLVDEPLKIHTSYKIGGLADVYVYPESKQQLIDLLKLLQAKNYPFFIIGKGSNVLASDTGFKGCIIDLTKHFSGIKIKENYIIAGAGSTLTAIAFAAIKNSLSGMEELAGIPGTLGGALLMNAGCYGNEISKVVKSVSFIDRENRYKELTIDKLEFGYRSSSLKNNIIIEAKLKLNKESLALVQGKTEEFLAKRRLSQPLDLPSCGSVFKRPENNFAGKLIEEAGLKGKCIGGAKVSEKHAGFIVNIENATARDVKELINEIKITVNEKFNVMLEEEVIYLG